MNRYLLFLLVFSFIITSCNGGRNINVFSQAEALMHSNPEQSLALLQTISTSKLKSERQQARYALLMSQALDKNYIDVNSDTLIKIAVNYYEKTNDHKNRMLAFYYEGIVLLNGSDYTASAVYFEKAIKEGLHLSDYLYLGLAYRALSQIMNETNNHTQAIRYDEKALEYFQEGELQAYELYEWLSLAIDCSNDKQYTRAISISDSLLSILESPILAQRLELVKASSIIELGECDYRVPVGIYQKADKQLFELYDWGYYAYSLDKLDRRDTSDYYLQYALSLSADHIDSTVIRVFQAKIENNRGNFKQSYQLLDKAVAVQDSLTRALLRQSVSVAQKDYFDKEAQYQALRAHNARQNFLLTGLVATLIIILGSFLVILRKRQSDALFKEQLAQLALEKDKNNRLLSENAHILGTLFSERLGHIDLLAADYMRAETPEKKEVIFKEYKKRCTSLMKDEHVFESLEYDLNRYCGGVMDKLKEEVPQIKKNNRKIISLFFAGVPNLSIQVITGKPSRKAIDVERSRYRKIIKDSGAKHSALFLEMLDTKKRQPEE